ncbi:MAG TPA: hypothetical protein VGI76_06900 [Solirubrobacteraceae bacterium]|jgi:hypothetical protein
MASSSHQEAGITLTTIALGFVGFVVILVAGAALVYGLVEDPAVSGPVAGAIGVIIAAILQRRWEKGQELERLRREQMSPIYEQLVSILKDNPEEAETAEFFKDLTTKLLLYGPAPIIKEWIEFRLHGVSADDPTNPTSLLNYEKLLLLVRKDLGHDDSELRLGDLLRVYVNDFDEMHLRWAAKQALQAGGQFSE